MSTELIGRGAATPATQAPLPRPLGAQRPGVYTGILVSLAGYHLLALLALFPWFFSWTGVVLCGVGVFLCGSLGISLCYHRLLTHRSFRCPKWLEHTFAVFALCALQDTPIRWVAIHRRHHQFADEQPDPHSPLVSFMWGHFGWIVTPNDDLERFGSYERYAKDLLRDRFYKRLERNAWQLWAILIQAVLLFGGGFLAGLVMDGSTGASVQLGASLLVWGLFVRTVVVWHQTWAVNSVCHLWGYRNYQTDEGSRNHWLVGYFSNGEGWHNNHHADSRSAKFGHQWWEIDTTWLLIRLLVLLGLAWDVATPNPRLASRSGVALSTHDQAENFVE